MYDPYKPDKVFCPYNGTAVLNGMIFHVLSSVHHFRRHIVGTNSKLFSYESEVGIDREMFAARNFRPVRHRDRARRLSSSRLLGKESYS